MHTGQSDGSNSSGGVPLSQVSSKASHCGGPERWRRGKTQEILKSTRLKSRAQEREMVSVFLKITHLENLLWQTVQENESI